MACTFDGEGEAPMFRSVTESNQSHLERRRAVRWFEGVLIGLAVFLLTFFAFGWASPLSLP